MIIGIVVMNWGKQGEEGTQFLFISPGLDVLGRESTF